tara:strand:+ start:753 stop:1334 length:582 start_codon:yes stop_codon:yes gene_type:complete
MASIFDTLLEDVGEDAGAGTDFIDGLTPKEEPKAPPSKEEQRSSMRGFDQPIPGQSLTGELGNAKYEQPPEYTDLDEFLTYFFKSVHQEGVHRDLLRLLDAGAPVNMLTGPVLMQAVSEGKVNMDLAMLAAEPVVTLLANMGREAGINVVVDKPESVGLDPRPIKKAFENKRKEVEPPKVIDAPPSLVFRRNV